MPHKSETHHGKTCLFIYSFIFTHFYFPASRQAMVTGVVPSSPGSRLKFLPRIGLSNPTARRFFIESIMYPQDRYTTISRDCRVDKTLYEYPPTTPGDGLFGRRWSHFQEVPHENRHLKSGPSFVTGPNRPLQTTCLPHATHAFPP